MEVYTDTGIMYTYKCSRLTCIHTRTHRDIVHSHTHRLLSIQYTDTHAHNKYICNKYTHVHVSKMHITYINSDTHVQTHTEGHRS